MHLINQVKMESVFEGKKEQSMEELIEGLDKMLKDIDNSVELNYHFDVNRNSIKDFFEKVDEIKSKIKKSPEKDYILPPSYLSEALKEMNEVSDYEIRRGSKKSLNVFLDVDPYESMISYLGLGKLFDKVNDKQLVYNIVDEISANPWSDAISLKKKIKKLLKGELKVYKNQKSN